MMLTRTPPGSDLKFGEWFCGLGGGSEGMAAILGERAWHAANHWDAAIKVHQLNHPHMEHTCADLHDADLTKFPYVHFFWASPECTHFTSARGDRREFDKQPDLFGETLPDEAADRSRALMWDVVKYLRAMNRRGTPVLGGVVENVIDARASIQWAEWLRQIQLEHYKTIVIAFNSAHARARVQPLVPQYRDRLYVAYIHESCGRMPDLNKWLWPHGWCPVCDEEVTLMQSWKKPGVDMGRWGPRQQYVYRCPHLACRNQIITPPALPALAVLDWTNLGTRIGDRESAGLPELKPNTLGRVRAGLQKHGGPILAATAGHLYERTEGSRTWPVTRPQPVQTATAALGLACPPMLIPTGGSWNETAALASEPMRVRTTRESEALVVPGGDAAAWLTQMRGGMTSQSLMTALSTLSTSGGHHALTMNAAFAAMVMRNNNNQHGDQGSMSTPAEEALRTLTTHGHQSLISYDRTLVPYYTKGAPRSVGEPVGALSTHDRYALASALSGGDKDLADVWFRMLTVPEIQGGMGFIPDYLLGDGAARTKVRLLGNAVTPVVPERLTGALVEAITGEDLDADLAAAA